MKGSERHVRSHEGSVPKKDPTHDTRVYHWQDFRMFKESMEYRTKPIYCSFEGSQTHHIQRFMIGENFGVEQFQSSSMGSVTSNIYACRFLGLSTSHYYYHVFKECSRREPKDWTKQS